MAGVLGVTNEASDSHAVPMPHQCDAGTTVRRCRTVARASPASSTSDATRSIGSRSVERRRTDIGIMKSDTSIASDWRAAMVSTPRSYAASARPSMVMRRMQPCSLALPAWTTATRTQGTPLSSSDAAVVALASSTSSGARAASGIHPSFDPSVMARIMTFLRPRAGLGTRVICTARPRTRAPIRAVATAKLLSSCIRRNRSTSPCAGPFR